MYKMAGISCHPPGTGQKGGGTQQAQVGKLTKMAGYLNFNKMAENLKCTKWRVLAAALLGLDRREEALSTVGSCGPIS